MVSLRRAGVLILLAALAGGFVGAAVFALLLHDDDEQRGELLRLRGDIERYNDIENTPFCVALQHFCLVVEGGEVRALYTYDTHALSRVRSCEIRWLPEFLFTDPDTGEASSGWFRADCSGTTYRYSGQYVFGPGARDMDEFPVKLTTETVEGSEGDEFDISVLEVETRRLVCGAVSNSTVPPGCERAPRPE